MNSRKELHNTLINYLEINNLYFQPPSGEKIKYPALVYKRVGFKETSANDQLYSAFSEYQLTLITDDPDNTTINKLIRFPMCTLTNTFVVDNMYHYVFKLFYKE